MNVREVITAHLYDQACLISRQVCTAKPQQKDLTMRLDDILTSRWLGFPAMLGLLALVFWLTISGANHPSELLANFFAWQKPYIRQTLYYLSAPNWLEQLLMEGVYCTLTWVVSVMLPPMAIFFPIFAFLEDLGYLPRVAFNLDRLFQKAGGHGKQALCMCMGFGCNAAGVTACRIIESRRERLLAILTNVFVPCNGRFPTLIALSALFFGSGAAEGHLTAAVGIVVSLVIFGILISLLTTWLLSRSLLAGNSSTFALEMPPYRLPRTGQLLWYSLRDRTLRVLGRAVCVAAPAGALIWLTAHLHWQGRSLLAFLAALLDPVARQLGLDGYIAVAFILGLPANEIVLPIMLMGYLATGTLIEPGSLSDLRHLLQAQGWTWLTALCTMLFSLLHYPCATTLLTIRRETGSRQWTLLAALLPLAIAGTVCFIVNHTVRYLANC